MSMSTNSHDNHIDLPDFSAEPEDHSFSDDLQALHDHEGDITLQKRKAKVVIQHRSWPLAHSFRSDDDRSLGIPSSQPVSHRPRQEDLVEEPAVEDQFPSSPPLDLTTMPFMSSPVAYPASSSPTLSKLSPKRKRADAPRRSPLRETSSNKNVQPHAIFLEDSDNEDVLPSELSPPAKRSRVDDLAEPSAPLTQDYQLASDTPVLHSRFESSLLKRHKTKICTTTGKAFNVGKNQVQASVTYEQLIASRSETIAGKAQRDYYGIDIHRLIDGAKAEMLIDETRVRPVETTEEVLLPSLRPQKTLMWTEKYRARKFTDLIGDDRTHRSVMHWLKRWDQIVFAGSSRPKSKAAKARADREAEETMHRKVLLLTGPPGLGKTTLAHVCAKQAGYEVQEINASDERSSNVVRGRIKDMVGTENVKGVDVKTTDGSFRKSGRPVCVIVDEVDGVVTGSGGSGEGGFIKALVDLVMLDQKNGRAPTGQSTSSAQRKKKAEQFRMMRPLILICNDAYHPSLKLLRKSTIAQVVHCGKPALNTVVARLQGIFDKEQVQYDGGAVRRLCEASWGVTTKKEGGSGSGSGEGDIRSILVVAEWVARKLKATLDPTASAVQRLSRQWVEENILGDIGQSNGTIRGLGRGGSREIVERVFQEGAGLSKAALSSSDSSTPSGITGVKGVAEAAKAKAMSQLRNMIDGFGESDRILLDCFATYPSHPYQDDNFLTKPTAAYDWLHFHDALSSAVYSSNEWELAPYLSQPLLAFHALFATSKAAQSRYLPVGNAIDDDAAEAEEALHPFAGPQASFAAHEAQKANLSLLQSLQSSLSLPLNRCFSSPADTATTLVPYLTRMLAPEINPTLITGSGQDKTSTASVRKASEKVLVARAVNAMSATGVRFERYRIEPSFSGGDTIGSTGPTKLSAAGSASNGWVYRMDPALDTFAAYETGGTKGFGTEGRGGTIGTRYAVRQVLEQDFQREEMKRNEEARKRRFVAGRNGKHLLGDDDDDEEEGIRMRKGEVARKEIQEGEKTKKVKRDFFGRVVVEVDMTASLGGEEDDEVTKRRKAKKRDDDAGEAGRTWLSFHEGYSNAVRKPITLAELIKGM